MDKWALGRSWASFVSCLTFVFRQDLTLLDTEAPEDMSRTRELIERASFKLLDLGLSQWAKWFSNPASYSADVSEPALAETLSELSR